MKRMTEEQYGRFWKDGFIILKQLLLPEEIAPLQQATHDDPSIRGSVVALKDSTGGAQELTCWTELGDDLLGVFPRLERLVDYSTDILGEEIYHWHSKLSLKRPGADGRWDWHQDYPYWYKEGCLYPNMITCTVAVDRSTAENGCLQVLRGTHLIGRIDHVPLGPTTAVDPERLEQVMLRHELVSCEMEPGDVLFFHGNLLHASGPNLSQSPRTLLHVTYNTRANAPFIKEGQEHHQWRPLEVAPDDAILSKAYRSAFSYQVFPQRRQGQTRSRYGQELAN